MPKRRSLDFSRQDCYCVDFKIVKMQDDTCFCVPRHGQHRIAAQHIQNRRLYEPDTHKLVSKLMPILGGSMIHAGTFFGDMLPTFSCATPGLLYAFEPVLENYVLAKLCVEMNELMNVVLLNAALGQKTGATYIDTGDIELPHMGGASYVSEKGQATALLAIDDLNLRDISLIQLDVEGFELNVLRGAARTLEQYSPVVMIEDNSDSCTPFLQSFDYRHVLDIPGLAVWARSDQEETLKTLGRIAP